MSVAPVIVIGSGLAGLMSALSIAPYPVLLATAGTLGLGGSSPLAQGGIAAALGANDCAALHIADTLEAGNGLCDPMVVADIIETAPQAIAMLEDYGVHFDRKSDGTYSLGLEAAHARHRIVHVHGDATGAGIMRALIDRVLATPSITVRENVKARRLITHEKQVCGVELDGIGPMLGCAVVLAMGGAGGLYEATTTPLGNLGQGAALAGRAGAILADMEFVQFHPTALAVSSQRLPLISEAVRGEGAILVDDRGERFMQHLHRQELAPRDVVARAMGEQLAQGRKVFLDARTALGKRFAMRFPAIDALLKRHGIDPSCDLIPVKPATHYHMGGVATDCDGRTSLPGLWAVGEAACTGLHGANRLASNSLLEAAVMGSRVGRAIAQGPKASVPLLAATTSPLSSDASAIRPIVSRALGLLRNEHELRAAIAALLPLVTTNDAAAVALVMSVAAFERQESRGSHSRTDYRSKNEQSQRSYYTLEQALVLAREIARAQPLSRIA